MDETSRLAYLRAMGIPAWQWRDREAERDTPDEAALPAGGRAAPPPGETAAAAGLGALRAALQEKPAGGPGEQSGADSAAAPADVGVGAAADPVQAACWQLTRAGDTLLVEQFEGAQLPPACQQLHANLAAALRRHFGSGVVSELLRWPPEAAPELESLPVADALAGRLDNLLHRGPPAQILLLGEATADQWQRLDYRACAGCRLLILPASSALLGSADAKRRLWAALTDV